MKNKKINKFHFYDPSATEIDSACLYVADMDISDFSTSCPNNLIVIGSTIHELCMEKADTVIQIPDGISAHEILQTCFDIYKSFETWNQALLMAIINRVSIADFLEIASTKLANPIALFDNSMNLMAKAGKFINSPKGTVWEKIGEFGLVLSDFFTIQEQYMFSEKNLNRSNTPYVFYPTADKRRAYASSSIWVNDKLCGSIGSVDINAPFMDGQFDAISHITETLKMYFKNNSEYMRIAENKLKYLDNLLEGATIAEEIVAYYLNKVGWKISDEFYFLSFNCPVLFTSTIESVSYIKLIKRLFPKALISVYQNWLIAVIKRTDYRIEHGKDIKQIEKILRENEMWCGISTPFDDFMLLRYYYAQSAFAAEYCKTRAASPVFFYEECFVHHILQSLGKREDLPAYCHPKILSLWSSDKEGQRELVHTLYQFLLNGRNIALTADNLHVHRNTLIYRLDKLSETLGVNLKDLKDDQLFFYLFSCLIAVNSLPSSPSV
jgi:hypothetical protein